VSSVHKTKRGEHLLSIAHQHGFSHYETIWNAPENEHLRAMREDPFQLVEGDEVFIPDRTWRKYDRSVDGEPHEFSVHMPPLKLRLVLHDQNREPLAGQTATFRASGRTEQYSADGDGLVEIPVQAQDRTAQLEVGDHQFELSIGELLPATEALGRSARLSNLDWWYAGAPTKPDDFAESLALELFEAEESRSCSGQVSDVIVGHLIEKHDLS
jgi:hypothetical protein